jgi:hypothetical protein
MKRIVNALLALCSGFAMALSAQTFTTLYNFSNPTGSGIGPSWLIQGADGNLYGTTFFGGTLPVSAGRSSESPQAVF